MDDRFSPRSAHSDDALAQTLHDPLFEPQPSFDFAESHNEEPRPLQPSSTGSPNAPNQNEQTFFNPVNGTSFEPALPFNSNANQYPQSTGVFEQQFNPARVWQGQTAHGGNFASAFPEANSMQQIVQNRRTTSQQFGQITPPDDSMNEIGGAKDATTEAVVMEAAQRAKSDKSERARNAANQRHAKAKKMRKDSESSIPVESDDAEGEAGDKKEKYREKNRLAAAKCRAKKKENIEDIEVKHRKLSAMNSSLKKQVQDLRGELTGLRTHALDHQDCNCQISRYNINQAKRVALGAEAPSPSMGFGGGIGSSFSYMHSPPGLGEMGRMPSQSNFNSPSNFAFASVTTPDDMGGMQSQEQSPYLRNYMQPGYDGQPFSQG